jgi:outer membrane protein
MIDPTNLNEYTMGYVGSMEGTKVVNISPGSKNYPFADQLKDNASKSLTLTLSIPIFNNLRNHTNVSNATINLDMTKNNLQITKNQVYKDIQQAHANATASMKKYIATEKALTSTEEAFKYSEQKYNVGLINSVEYSTSKNQLTKVKSDLVQAKFDYIFRKTILDFYRGKTIKL